ncbi:hypothetical protein ABT298_07930 [Streptomyces sp. NPDC001034]|uniref:hypothetical protein n=1 Tax=Streptomyces sp. NPDC001034 TaxID=3154375 RepID=UPI003325BEFC
MNAALPQAETSEPAPIARWEITEGRDAEFQRLLTLLFGPRAAKQTEPGNG